MSATPNVIYASQFSTGNDTVDLTNALNAARAATSQGNRVGSLVLDARIYGITAPLDTHNVGVVFWPGSRIQILTDFAAGLPPNARFGLDMQPSVPLGPPVQNPPSQASGSTAYTANQVVSIWIFAQNSRNGGATPISAMQQITVGANGNQITANWVRHTGIDATTTYSVAIDQSGGTNSANALIVATGQTGSSWTDTTGAVGAGNPPTVDTTGGVGINAPDFRHNGQNPIQGTCLERPQVLGPSFDRLGVLSAHVSAIRQGGSTLITQPHITGGVFAGISQNNDHEYVIGPGYLGGYYGVYRAGPHGDDGDQVFRDLQINGDWACFGIAREAGFGGAVFDKIHLANSPFGFYSEQNGADGDGLMLGDCTFTEVSWESIGNGAIFCAGTSRKGVSQCDFRGCQSGKGLDPGVALPITATDWQGVPIGRHNCTIDLNGFMWSSNWGSPPVSLNPGSGTCGISALVTNGGDMDITGFLGQLNSQKLPWSNIGASSTPADTAVVDTGRQIRIYKADMPISTGDLVQLHIGGEGQPEIDKSDGIAKVLGVCALSADTRTQALVFRTGKVGVNCGANPVSPGQVVIPDPANPGQAKAGTAASTNIVGVAVLGASNGWVLVELQGLG